MTKPHDDLLFARYQGFYEYLTEGPDWGRTHETDDAWSEAYDEGRNDAEALTLAGREARLPKGERCWISTGNAEVVINTEGEGVIVDIFPSEQEVPEAIASTWVHDNDLISER